MKFKPESVQDFLTFLTPYVPQIRATDGCLFLQVLQDKTDPTLVMTLSHWNAEADLEGYRHSALFKLVWAETKQHFADSPEAYSLNALETRV